MAAIVQAGPAFAASNPNVVIESAGGVAGGAPGRYYDVSPDGHRFLVIRSAATSDARTLSQLNVVLNWGEELKRLAPAKR